MPFIVIILFGALAASFALILELLAVSLFSLSGQTLFVSIPSALGGTFSLETLPILLGIAFIEEASKYTFLRQYARRLLTHTEISLNHTLILGTLFGLGFTLLETFFLMNAPALPPFSVLLGIASVHIATSIAFALFLFTFSNLSQQEPNKRSFSALSLLSAAILFHTLYNLAILSFS